MNLHRRFFACFAMLAAAMLAGCATPEPVVDPAARAALAPTGTLRVGVYPGSPTSLVREPKSGEWAGVAHDLGRELARQLGVPVQVVEASRVALVIDAIKAGQIDFTFTNVTESRARDIDFTAPLLQLELGYLVPPGSTINTIADVDRPGSRIPDGRWGVENLAMAIPKGREAGMPFLLKFAQDLRTSGKLQAMVARAGLRGTAKAE